MQSLRPAHITRVTDVRRTLLRHITAGAAITSAALCAGLAFPGIASARQQNSPNQLQVTATADGFRTAGHLTTGPVTIHLTNAANAPHAVDLYRLTPGVTVDKMLDDARSQDWEAFASDLADGGPGNGNPNIVSPGHSATTVGDGFQAGTYAVIDGTPGLNGVPNFMQGFATSVEVSATDAPAAPPTSDGEVLITDTAVHLPPAISTGHGTFAVHYDGRHEFQLLRLRPDATVRDAFDYWIARFSGQDPGGTPPAEFVGGLADLRPGVNGWVTLDLPNGTYGVWSIEDGDFTDVVNGVTATFTVQHGADTR